MGRLDDVRILVGGVLLIEGGGGVVGLEGRHDLGAREVLLSRYVGECDAEFGGLSLVRHTFHVDGVLGRIPGYISLGRGGEKTNVALTLCLGGERHPYSQSVAVGDGVRAHGDIKGELPAMGEAEVIAVGGRGRSLIIELGVILIGALTVLVLALLEVLVIEQEEVAHGAVEPHLPSVDGVCLDVALLLPVGELLIGHGTHALLYLFAALGGAEREVAPHAVGELQQRVDGESLACADLLRERVEILGSLAELAVLDHGSGYGAEVRVVVRWRGRKERRRHQRHEGECQHQDVFILHNCIR